MKLKTHNNRFPAKLLLLGEHTVLKGSQALAIPFPFFKGYWSLCSSGEDLDSKQQQLPRLLTYLKDLQQKKELLAKLDLYGLEEDLRKGLYFESDIPNGYGLGSSGALCAALYERYAYKPKEEELLSTKNMLAQIESFFHGSSSGIDPLIIWVNQPILIKKDNSIETVAFKESNASSFSFFLLDTGISRQTAPFVNLFLKKCEQPEYLQSIRTNLSVHTDRAIQNLLQKDLEEAFENLLQLSAFQQDFFTEMIPPPFLEVWRRGLQSQDYVLKLCGAGGGGFLLGMAKSDKPILGELSEAYSIISFSI